MGSGWVHTFVTKLKLSEELTTIGAALKECGNWMSKSKKYTSRVLDQHLTNFAKLQDAVTSAHETSDAFSDETLQEQAVFQYSKKAEFKDMLGSMADEHIDFYRNVCNCMPMPYDYS